MIFELPIPPSSNQRLAPVMLGKSPAMVKTPLYRAWMSQAVELLTEDQPEDWKPFDMPVGVFVEIRFPDRRKRDLDNVLKPLNDVITNAHIWVDDSLIGLQIAKRGPVEKPGMVRVVIWPLAQFNPIKTWNLFDVGGDFDQKTQPHKQGHTLRRT